MAWHNDVWMHRIANCVNILMFILVSLMLVIVWSDVYSAYYDPTYPIGMAEGGWSYRTHYNKFLSGVADTIVLSVMLAFLWWIRRKNPLLVLITSLASPLIFIIYLWFDFEREYLGGFLMNIRDLGGF